MKDDALLPINCAVVDPNLELGGRDDWRFQIASAYPELFDLPRGLPECGSGWSYIIEQACIDIRKALKTDDALKIMMIRQRYGVLNIFWEGSLSAHARTGVERATEQAYLESARTCEVCGFAGRLYTCAGWRTTACTGHGKGTLAPLSRRTEAVRVVRGIINGTSRILSCRQYDRKYDCFVDVRPDALDLRLKDSSSQTTNTRREISAVEAHPDGRDRCSG